MAAADPSTLKSDIEPRDSGARVIGLTREWDTAGPAHEPDDGNETLSHLEVTVAQLERLAMTFPRQQKALDDATLDKLAATASETAETRLHEVMARQIDKLVTAHSKAVQQEQETAAATLRRLDRAVEDIWTELAARHAAAQQAEITDPVANSAEDTPLLLETVVDNPAPIPMTKTQRPTERVVTRHESDGLTWSDRVLIAAAVGTISLALAAGAVVSGVVTLPL